MRRIAAVIVLILVGFAVEAGSIADDLQAMQGQWSVTIAEMDGKPAGDDFKNVRITFLIAGDEYRILADDKAISGGKLNIDARKTPHTIDATITEGPHKGMTQKGIYEIKGDTMTAAFARPGGARPAEFKTKQGSGQSIVRYARIKK